MQLIRETSELNLIRAWEGGRVLIGDRWVGGNLILSAERIIVDWAVQDPHALSLEDLGAALALEPEIILIGTGERALLPDTELMGALAERAIGLEFMTTPAACRTYNVLVHEQRRVVAVLFNTPAPSSR
jgi:uncharacterized protein